MKLVSLEGQGQHCEIYICVYIYVCVCVCVCVYMCVCVCIYIYIHIGILLSYKKNEILLFATTKKELESIMLRKVSQRKINTIQFHSCVEFYICFL